MQPVEDFLYFRTDCRLCKGAGWKGNLAEFAQGVRPLLSQEIPPIDEVCICLLEEYRVRELAEHLTEAAVIC